MISGSDDGNVRLWKARASEKLGVVNTREKAAMEYRDSLRERWKMDAEVRRLSRYVQAQSNLLAFYVLKGMLLGTEEFHSLCAKLLNSSIQC